MFFIQAEPFERNYSQSQEQGGGGGAGGGPAQQNDHEISKRQKEIITATWNQLKGSGGAQQGRAENASFLSQVQSKLRDQAKSLSDRMQARQLEDAGDSFKTFVDAMNKAVAAMGPASDKLKAAKLAGRAGAGAEGAAQYLLRAEATRRDIEVAFGRQGGGGGGGGGGNSATRDLQGLFDLELDTEKNQYENTRQAQSADQRQQAIDDALQKLQDLARRQQELAEQQRQGQQLTSDQRWQQELLRREAEQLRQQMQQLARNDKAASSAAINRGSKDNRASRVNKDNRANKGSKDNRDNRASRGSKASRDNKGSKGNRGSKGRWGKWASAGSRGSKARRDLSASSNWSRRSAAWSKPFRACARRSPDRPRTKRKPAARPRALRTRRKTCPACGPLSPAARWRAWRIKPTRW